MQKNRTTLVMAILSVVICLAMLAGTTFAWFTDSVVSGNNTLVAGNLHVSLEFMKQGDSDWTSAEEAGGLFDDVLWEPGQIQVVYYKITNTGTLSAKYQFGVLTDNEKCIEVPTGVGDETDDVYLSTFIYGIAIDLGDEEPDLEDVGTTVDYRALVSRGVPLKDPFTCETVEGSSGTVLTLGTGKTRYGVIILGWEPGGYDDNHDYDYDNDFDNLLNYPVGYEPPSIDIKIYVTATQAAVEKDAFGKDDYDEDAVFPPNPAPVNTPRPILPTAES